MEEGVERIDRAICWLFGHMPVRVDTVKMTAWCGRCGEKLDVSYDMYDGQTVCTGKHEDELQPGVR